MGVTRDVAGFAAGLTYADIPDRIHPRTKAQILSVVAAIHASRYSEGAAAAARVAASWGSGDDAISVATGARLPRHSALFADACASVAFDFDDYLFAGHTGHSAVLAALHYGQMTGASGRDVLAAMTVANEVGGRLGASLLLGPQNGQMWAYIHLLEGACATGRLLGLDARQMTNAVGIAFTQPVYPLYPGFMGPDSKMLLPASTSVEGARAAELAQAGWTGSHSILEDRQGFLHRFNEQNLGWMLSGLGRAWVSDTLTYKVVPGCAYIDTAVDSMREIFRSFEDKHGRAPAASDVESIHVDCGLFTSGMETLSSRYKDAERLEPISINFSVALSFGLMLTSGRLSPQFLSHAHLDANRVAIEAAASTVTLQHNPELDRRATVLQESGGFSLRSLLGAESKSLDDVSFEGYTMAFPAEVTMRTTSGEEFSAGEDSPLGGAGRPWDETWALVCEKLRANFTGDADAVIDAVGRLEDVDDVRELAPLLAARR